MFNNVNVMRTCRPMLSVFIESNDKNTRQCSLGNTKQRMQFKINSDIITTEMQLYLSVKPLLHLPVNWSGPHVSLTMWLEKRRVTYLNIIQGE